MTMGCCNDKRRQAVRAFKGRVGLDFVEVSTDQTTLYVYFLGKLPAEFGEDGPALARHLAIEGGARITGIRIVDVDPHAGQDEESDDWLEVRLDRYGDHSRYRLRLVDVADVDPMYASAEFSFKAGCPSDLDCVPADACIEPTPTEPALHYLAKDYASFRRLIKDRLALLSPAWDPHHVPDLGVTLIELLAYAGDYLSYYQDAVATEAYLDTARQRISVRRHARLVDYCLHEGCNARAWVHVTTSDDIELPAAQVAFLSGVPADAPLPIVLGPDRVAGPPALDLEFFEPVAPADGVLSFKVAHNSIAFYDWGRDDCCLPRGSTRATLLDAWADREGERRQVDLREGDVLVLKELRGPRSGLEADADPDHAWPVRLTKVVPNVDTLPIEPNQARPTPLLEVEWHPADALPFPLCLSSLGPAPECERLRDVSAALGNVVLVDHGRRVDAEPLGSVPTDRAPAECECEGQPSDVAVLPARFRWRLQDAPLTHTDQPPGPADGASVALAQDPRRALPALIVRDDGGRTWTPVFDLLSSRPNDAHVVAEIDNQGVAYLRFGDDDLGRRPEAGHAFVADYRLGNGVAGNVGAGSINRILLRDGPRSGLDLRVDNPLPARGGTEPEPVSQARMLAPSSYRRHLLRAITADDYARIAERTPDVQRAACQMVWTGSWYEAEVALDALGQVPAGDALLEEVATSLHRVRRMGHDLHVQAAVHVPLRLALQVCALPGHERGAVKAALLDRFCAGRRRDGQPGYFHPDRLSFGQPVRMSALVAEAMSVPGVECAHVLAMQRLHAPAAGELEEGVLHLAPHEIARVDNDPDFPEHGGLSIEVGGGR